MQTQINAQLKFEPHIRSIKVSVIGTSSCCCSLRLDFSLQIQTRSSKLVQTNGFDRHHLAPARSSLSLSARHLPYTLAPKRSIIIFSHTSFFARSSSSSSSVRDVCPVCSQCVHSLCLIQFFCISNVFCSLLFVVVAFIIVIITTYNCRQHTTLYIHNISTHAISSRVWLCG